MEALLVTTWQSSVIVRVVVTVVAHTLIYGIKA